MELSEEKRRDEEVKLHIISFILSLTLTYKHTHTHTPSPSPHTHTASPSFLELLGLFSTVSACEYSLPTDDLILFVS